LDERHHPEACLRHAAPTLQARIEQARPATRGRWLRFLLHYLEMVIAMLVGMIVLGAVVRGVVAVAGLDYSSARFPELASLEMAVTMSAGMAAWMRYRGHDWASTLEMCGAMFAPIVVLFPLLWFVVISGQSMIALMHAAMMPLMLVVMLWRRSQYTG